MTAAPAATGRGSARSVSLLLVLVAWGLGAVAMRRSEAEEVTSKALAPKNADDNDCDALGPRLEDDAVAAEVRSGDGVLRLRKAAQRICDGLVGKGSLGGAAHAVAIYAACKADGGAPGYRCKGTNSTEHAEKKMRAAEVIGEKDVRLYTRVNRAYHDLQSKLEDANRGGNAPKSLAKAAELLAEHRGQVEAREALCRADYNLTECGDPLVFLMDLRALYGELGECVGSLADAAGTCTSTKHALLGAASRGGKSVDRLGRRAIAQVWRHRVALMAALVIKEGAKPFVDELAAIGMEEALAEPMGDAFEVVVNAMKSISCDLLEEPLVMAKLVHVSARFLGGVMASAAPEDESAEIEGFKARPQGLRGVPRAFVRQVRRLGEVLSSHSAVPVASEVLVVFAHKFFHELAGGICEAIRTGPAAAVDLARGAVEATSPSKLLAEATSFAKEAMEATSARVADATSLAKEAAKAATGSRLFADAAEVASAPARTVKASVVSGAVPRGGAATILAAGAFGGILDGSVFADPEAEGAREAGEMLAEAAAMAAKTAKPRRGKRDRAARSSAAASLAEVEGRPHKPLEASDATSAIFGLAKSRIAQRAEADLDEAPGATSAVVGLVKHLIGGEASEEGSGAPGVDPLGALAASLAWLAKKTAWVAQKTPRTPETKELIGALSNVQIALPMFALVAWSGEHIFALMDAESSSDAPPMGRMPTLKELKARSKDVMADVRKLAGDAIQECNTERAMRQLMSSPTSWFRAEKKAKGRKVCIVGGAGGIGQPLSMLMASHPDVAELSIYDLTVSAVPAEGVAMDMSHIDSKCVVKGYSFDVQDRAVEKAGDALTGCDLVLVPAGMPRKPGMDRKDLLKVNADIARNIVEACAKFCPEAVVGLIVNPVNSVVPAMCELWKKKGLNPKKIVGVTTLDVLRADKFVHEFTAVPLEKISVPVIGGHAGKTILPVFSQDKAAATIPAWQIPYLDTKVQNAGTVVVEKKQGKGSATLSMAYAGARLARAVLAGLAGHEATECAFVESTVTDIPYFASKVTFGLEGVKTVHPIGKLSAHEQVRLEELMPRLREEVQAGMAYAAAHNFTS